MKKYELSLIVLILITLACQSISNNSLLGEERYLKLREDALNTKPEDIDSSIEPNSDTPYGIVLDMTIAEGYTETLVSFSNGYSNFLYSNGDEGAINSDYTTLEKDTKLFVVASKRYLIYMEITNDFPLPREGYLIFYVLTPNGIFTSGEVEQFVFETEKVSYHGLFSPALPMISEYRNYP